eukprot:299120_1
MANEAEAKLLDEETTKQVNIAPAAPCAVPINNRIGIDVGIGIDEGVQSQAVQIIQINDNTNEGQAPLICNIMNCDELSVHQCCICHGNICNNHCRIISLQQQQPIQYRCIYCVQNNQLNLLIQPQRNINNRGIARCCVRRLIIRLLLFFILIIIASIYSSSSHSS